MPTMYETIMDLPLFKGIGEDQLSLMLEKTSMEFLKFKKGDIIHRPGERVESIDFILSGKVRNSYKISNYNIRVEETLGESWLLGALHLYGLDTSYPSLMQARTDVSILRIDKAQYMNILKSDPIYILNFINYLSAGAQKSPDRIQKGHRPGISRTLAYLVYSLVSVKAEEVYILGDDSEISTYCGVTLEDFNDWKNKNAEDHSIIVLPEGLRIKTLKSTI